MKKKFRKPCRVCGVYFTPTGSACKMCDNCSKKSFKEGLLKRMEKT